MKRVIEAGHIYSSIGPNEDTAISIEIAKMIRRDGDIVVQFIDDIHEDSILEKKGNSDIILPEIDRNCKMYESSTIPLAKDIADILMKKSGSKITEDNKGNILFNFSKNAGKKKTILYNDGSPSCIMMDLAFTLMKNEKFDPQKIINILPKSYRKQQKAVHELLFALESGGEIDSISLESFLFDSVDIYDSITTHTDKTLYNKNNYEG